MVDQNFYNISSPVRLAELASRAGCEIKSGNPDLSITGICSIEEPQEQHICFVDNPKYFKQIANAKAAAIIVPQNIDPKYIACASAALLESNIPYLSYAHCMRIFYSSREGEENTGNFKIGKNCHVGKNVIIEDGAQIGDNCFLESNIFIGRGVRIGSNCKIYSSATIRYSIIGDNVIIMSGANIGTDGFGFATDKDGTHHKIFHAGRVIIGSDVEIGAAACIDRGSVRDTIMQDGCRIDNLVQIGHNAQIGKGAVLAGQCGISGSTKVGDYAMLGGQSGVAGHLSIGRASVVAGGSGVVGNIKPGQTVAGYPALDISQWRRQSIALKKLTNKS